MAKRLIPTLNRVLIEKITSPAKTTAGILLPEKSSKVLGCRALHSWVSNTLRGIGQQIHHQSTAVGKEQVDPFSLVADELSLMTNRLRSMVPKLASAAEYFFKVGVEGKRFRPTV